MCVFIQPRCSTLWVPSLRWTQMKWFMQGALKYKHRWPRNQNADWAREPWISQIIMGGERRKHVEASKSPCQNIMIIIPKERRERKNVKWRGQWVQGRFHFDRFMEIGAQRTVLCVNQQNCIYLHRRMIYNLAMTLNFSWKCLKHFIIFFPPRELAERMHRDESSQTQRRRERVREAGLSLNYEGYGNTGPGYWFCEPTEYLLEPLTPNELY